MIAIAGGSGLLGQRVVTTLLGQGEHVRVLVRDLDGARSRVDQRAEVVTADVRDAVAVNTAVQGASAVISAAHGLLGGRGAGPTEVDHLGNVRLSAAARAVGADVVLVSVAGASPDSPVELFRAKYLAEEAVRESGAAWSIVRSSAFLETWLQILTRTAGRSGHPLVFGRGEQPIPFVSADDVADVVSTAATNKRFRGQMLEIAGEPLTMNELARALQTARNWPGTIRHLPRPLLRSLAVIAGPIKPGFARQNRTALAMDALPPAGVPSTSSPLGTPLRTVLDVLGTAALS